MKYFFYQILGFLFLACGIIGIVVPLLPTTPFLLLSASLFFRSSPRVYNWLLNHRYLGTYIRNFQQKRTIPLRVKIIITTLLWITSLHCFFLILNHWILKSFMLLIAISISIFIFSFKKSSSLIRHAAENEGNVPQRFKGPKRSYPSRRTNAINI